MRKSSRKILVVEFFSRGGLLHYSLQLAQAMAAEASPGVAVLLLTAKDPETTATAPGVRLQARLSTWNPQHRPNHVPRKLLRALRGLRYIWVWMQVLRAVKREKPALILLTDLEHRCDGWFVRRLHRWCRRQHPPSVLADIWHNVEPFERCRPGSLQRRHLHWRMRMAQEFDTVFVHGRTLQTQFRNLTRRQACAIPHGDQTWIAGQAGPDPDLDQRFRLPPGKPLALLFGALNTYKGVGILLHALALLPAALRPMLLIAGMPTAVSELGLWRQFVQAHALESWLRWDTRYIPTPEIAWYFRRADWVVLPYLTASQSGVGHLALTFGKPLLVTATGGLPELVDGNGLVVPANDPAALAQALAQMATEPVLRQRWGRRSADLARTRHGWPPIARTVLAEAAPQLLLSAEAIATNAAGGQASAPPEPRIPEQERAR